MIVIDKHAYNNGLLNVNPILKFTIGAILLMASIIFNNKIFFTLVMGLMSFSIIFLAKIDFKYYIKLLTIPTYFLIFSIIATLISISKEPIDFIVNIKLYKFYIGISSLSLNISINLLLRSMCCLTCTYFLVLTIPFNQMILILKKLYIPKTAIEITVLVYRFIFIFLEEIQEIYTSQHLRFGYINLKTSYKSTSILISTLFIRVMNRYKDMSISLETKLYNGEFYV
jgi:cobalt/nickel transport system permease protein